MSRKKLIKESFEAETNLFRMCMSYYQKNGMEQTKKVLTKIITFFENRGKPQRAPLDVNPGINFIEEKKKI